MKVGRHGFEHLNLASIWYPQWSLNRIQSGTGRVSCTFTVLTPFCGILSTSMKTTWFGKPFAREVWKLPHQLAPAQFLFHLGFTFYGSLSQHEAMSVEKCMWAPLDCAVQAQTCSIWFQARMWSSDIAVSHASLSSEAGQDTFLNITRLRH